MEQEYLNFIEWRDSQRAEFKSDLVGQQVYACVCSEKLRAAVEDFSGELHINPNIYLGGSTIVGVTYDNQDPEEPDRGYMDYLEEARHILAHIDEELSEIYDYLPDSIKKRIVAAKSECFTDLLNEKFEVMASTAGRGRCLTFNLQIPTRFGNTQSVEANFFNVNSELLEYILYKLTVKE